MVTTTSLMGDLKFKAQVLFQSELAEDHQIAEMAEQQLSSLIEKLVPVLIYVDQAMAEIRGVMVLKVGNFTLILSRDGRWYRSVGEKVVQDSNQWRYHFLSEIVEGLERIFKEAIEKKRIHLEAVEKRRDLLNKVGAVIRGEAVPATETK